VEGSLRIGSFGDTPGLLKRLDEEEAQSRQSLRHCVRCQFVFCEQCRLVFADAFRTQLVRRSVEVPGEMLNGMNVAIDGGLSVIATLEFFEHHLAKMGHRDLLSL
jgi:hypothetical protein